MKNLAKIRNIYTIVTKCNKKDGASNIKGPCLCLLEDLIFQQLVGHGNSCCLRKMWITTAWLRNVTTVPVSTGERNVHPEACCCIFIPYTLMKCASFSCQCDYSATLGVGSGEWGGSGLKEAQSFICICIYMRVLKLEHLNGMWPL